MKVIIYSGQNKFTVDNISIPSSMPIAELLKNRKEYTVSASDLKHYNFQITSTRGAIADAEDEDFIMNEDIEREVEEGINWKLESVN